MSSMPTMLDELDARSDHSTQEELSTVELSERWRGLPTPGTLRNWRMRGKGPQFVARMEAGERRVSYAIAVVEAFELACSSIPRKKPWKGEFLSHYDLLERWHGTPDEVTENTLREWRSERGRQNGPPFVTVHYRHALYPIEAIRIFEADRARQRLARARATRPEPNETSVGKTYGEILADGPQI